MGNPRSLLSIGYVPNQRDLSAPGDRRRFAGYARSRGLDFEIASIGKRYDLVILSGATDITRWVNYPRRFGRLVYDFINSYLSVPRGSFRAEFRGLAKFVSGKHKIPKLNYWKALEAMCARADVVVCTTDEQRNLIKAFCSKVEIVPDIHDEIGDTLKTTHANKPVLNLVWEGLPQNAKSVNLIAPVINDNKEASPLRINFVTDEAYYKYTDRFLRKRTIKDLRHLSCDVAIVPWHKDTFAKRIAENDLAIIPIDLDDPFEAGKPENKLVLLWKIGMPVLASSTPAYERTMQRAGLGDMVCTTTADWLERIERYRADPDLRAEAAARALEFAHANYNSEQIMLRWDTALERALGD